MADAQEEAVGFRIFMLHLSVPVSSKSEAVCPGFLTGSWQTCHPIRGFQRMEAKEVPDKKWPCHPRDRSHCFRG